MKIVINKCFGGFSISKECAEFMAEKGHELARAELEDYISRCTDKKLKAFDKHWYGAGYVGGFERYSRTDPILVEAVEWLGSKKASGECAKLDVIEIPDDVEYNIHNNDGFESVHEIHRSW